MSSEFRDQLEEALPQDRVYPSPLKLDIGCGTQKLEGYIGVDAYVETDIKAEMWAIPLGDGTVDEIYSSHALEHVPMAQVQPTLREWLRILRPGGTLVLQVPNLDYAARFWLTHKPDEHAWAEMILFGNQAHAGEFHKCGFTPMGIQGDLQQSGFIVDQVAILWAYNQETLQAKARKPDRVPAMEIGNAGAV
jgi:predicted SAM-dependent methyltransferase